MALLEGALVSVLLFVLTLAGKALALGDHLSPVVAAWAPVVALVLLSAGVLFVSDHRWVARLPHG